MKKIKYYIFIAIISLSLVSCTLTKPYAVTNNKIGDKVGVSKTTSLFSAPTMVGVGGNIEGMGISLNKNYGIIEATKNGKIKNIATVDVKIKTIAFVTFYELIVTGN